MSVAMLCVCQWERVASGGMEGGGGMEAGSCSDPFFLSHSIRIMAEQAKVRKKLCQHSDIIHEFQ